MKRLTFPTIACALLLLGLWSCGSSGESEQEKTADPSNTTTEAPPANDLASVKKRLEGIQNQLSNNMPETTGDVANQLALADEMGVLWKSPAEGYPGFLNQQPITAYIPAVFQDATNAKAYHFQGSAEIGGEKKRWNGTITIKEAPMLVEGTGKATHGIALGTFSIKENPNQPNPYLYEGTVQCMFTSTDQDSPATRRTAAELSSGSPSILFVGIRTPSEGETAEIAVWGLGEEEDLKELLGLTQSM